MIIDGQKVAFLDGCRTPFQRVSTGFGELRSYDLARAALKGLAERQPLADADQVILGSVISNVNTSNVARDAMLGANYQASIPGYTVTQACISANRAITNGADLILTGQGQLVVAGGVDSMSDVPIRFRKPVRSRLLASQKARGPLDYLRLLKGLKLRDLAPEVPAIEEFSTGLSMGADCDRLAAEFSVTREAQDAFSLRSHHLAAHAWKEGWMEREVISMRVPPGFKPLDGDNTYRADSTPEKLASLRPAFVKPHGTVTAGNASFLTDGAAVTALISGDKAKADGHAPQVFVRGYLYSAQNPDGELLLGPAYALAALLDEAGMGIADIDVFELHEAFAGQVLANLNALASTNFCRKRLGRRGKLGEIPEDKLNCGGGSLSLGHPFGATGARLLTTAANRLLREDGKFALIAACAAGGMGSAILLERV